MSHLEIELSRLKSDLIEMFAIVISQLSKSKEALIKLDKDLAREIRVNERRVNSFELKLDRDCENIIALFNPVAIDLRLVLASLKINSNLERIGDIAEGIANYVLNFRLEPEPSLLEASRLIEMFDVSIGILEDVMKAYEQEDTSLARNVFKKDEMLDEYDFSNGVRGKYVGRLMKNQNVIILEPDVAKVFTDSESVNQALRGLLPIIQRQAEKRV